MLVVRVVSLVCAGEKRICQILQDQASIFLYKQLSFDSLCCCYSYISQHNLLYVGGRPSTRLFRFSGSISNLFVGSGALSLGNIVNLHRQAFANGGINPISTDDGSVRYCYPYQGAFEQCYLNSFPYNDFRVRCDACISSVSCH